jgi:hypothetical protein
MSEKFRKDFQEEILEGEKILKILNTKTKIWTLIPFCPLISLK